MPLAGVRAARLLVSEQTFHPRDPARRDGELAQVTERAGELVRLREGVLGIAETSGTDLEQPEQRQRHG